MNIYVIPLNLQREKRNDHIEYIRRLPQIARFFCSMPWTRSHSRYLDFLISMSEEGTPNERRTNAERPV
jgi:hypothetical protein